MEDIFIVSLLSVLLVLGIYNLTPRPYRWIILLLASYGFYFVVGGKFIGLLSITTALVFLFGKLIYKIKYSSKRSTMEVLGGIWYRFAQNNIGAKQILTLSLVILFLILGYFKYFNFFVDTFLFWIADLFPNLSFSHKTILLPLGISFYSFQAAGYLIDIYRGRIEPDRNLAKFAIFLSYFPQIIQGPISRYDQLAKQLYEPKDLNYKRIKFGFQLVGWGLFKKLVIADRAAVIVNTVFSNSQNYDGSILFFSSFLYCMQIYGDFSGGIDIARGISEMFGITLVDNFNHPFFANSLEDFWRRWHITLGSWAKEYIFFPLSVSKNFATFGKKARKVVGASFGKKIPSLIGMMVTFFVIGIWHGPEWKYVFYGLYNGVIISTSILFSKGTINVLKKYAFIDQQNPFWKGYQVMSTLFLIIIGRFFSRATDLGTAFLMIENVFTNSHITSLLDDSISKLGLDAANLWVLLISFVILLGVDYLQELGISIREIIASRNIVLRWGLYFLFIFSILIFGYYGLDFNRSGFIYNGF